MPLDRPTHMLLLLELLTIAVTAESDAEQSRLARACLDRYALVGVGLQETFDGIGTLH